MKKILIIGLISLIMITGCNNKEKENKELVEQINEVYGSYVNLDVLTDDSLKAHIGLSSNDVENYIGAVSNLEIKDIYLIIKPQKGHEERVKRLMDAYVGNLTVRITDELNNTIDEELKKIKEQVKTNYENATYEEIDGYYVYVIADDSSKAKILDVIKNNLD